jgi:hypothetical protein
MDYFLLAAEQVSGLYYGVFNGLSISDLPKRVEHMTEFGGYLKIAGDNFHRVLATEFLSILIKIRLS